MTDLAVISALDAIALNGEEGTRDMLREFSCAKNPAVQRFVRDSAVDFARQGISMTHLVYSRNADSALLGFFALTYKILRVPGGALSRTAERRIAKFAERDAATGAYMLPAPLIAQLGKNDLPGGSLAGRELLALAEARLRAVMADVGGRAVYLECEDEPKLMRFYETCGYVRAARRRDPESGAAYHVYVKFLTPSPR